MTAVGPGTKPSKGGLPVARNYKAIGRIIARIQKLLDQGRIL